MYTILMTVLFVYVLGCLDIFLGTWQRLFEGTRLQIKEVLHPFEAKCSCRPDEPIPSMLH